MKRSILLILVALGATAAAYWPGLSGGFLLDDSANLAPVWRWLAGETGWARVVLENESGPLGRPISMLSFVATAAVWGQSAFAFKAVSLAIHLAIGCILFVFLATLFQRDRLLQSRRFWFAAAIAAVWLLHPLFASTVLYVVQRMAMLSALFVLLALWAFVRGRLSLDRGEHRTGGLWLFLGVPAFTLLAALSKETGLLVPLFCAVLEWVYFRPIQKGARLAPARWFMRLFVFAPVVAGTLFLVLNPDFFLNGYVNRPFSVVERLLTQSRVLFDYAGSLLLPAGQEFSLYRDNYAISTGLLSPVTTLLSILGWLALALAAIALRRIIPGLAAGLGLFLVGHAMESSIFPLLIYFEHRNYLPAVGVFIAVTSVLAYAGGWISARMDRPALVFASAAGGLMLALGFATYARSIAWQSPMHLLEQSVEQYPDSRFGRMELAAQIMNTGPVPNAQRAIEQYRHLQTLEQPSTVGIGYLGEIAVTCFARGEADGDLLDRAFERQPETIAADYLKATGELAKLIRRNPCEGIPLTGLADHLVNVADQTQLPQRHGHVWRIRFQAAQLYAARQRHREALEQASLAWEAGAAELPVAMFMAALHIRIGEFGAAARLLDEIGPQIPQSDETGQALLAEYREAIEEARNNASLSRGFGGGG